MHLIQRFGGKFQVDLDEMQRERWDPTGTARSRQQSRVCAAGVGRPHMCGRLQYTIALVAALTPLFRSRRLLR
jgi:hypothetical protein